MKVAVFSAQKYDQEYLLREAEGKDIAFTFFDTPLTPETASLAQGYQAINCFVNDDLSAETLVALNGLGIRHISLRCAGFNNVDLACAKRLGVTISRVPAYSPEAVAEHTIALLLSVNRKLHKAYNRIKEDNFSLNGLMGFNIHGKTVGIIGTGKIGIATVKILKGFGANVICHDPYQSEQAVSMGLTFVPLDTLFAESDVISLHCPLNGDTAHLINANSIATMKNGVVLINTSRGGLVDTRAIIAALKTHKIAGIGLDVYEMESELFFQDRSAEIILDDVFQRLLTFPNVIVTGHQGFFTHEAMTEIAQITTKNLLDFGTHGIDRENQVIPN